MSTLPLALVTASPSAVLVSNGTARVLFANPAASMVTGYSNEELVGMPIADVFDEALATTVSRTVHSTSITIDSSKHVDGTICYRDGSQRPIDAHIVRLDLDDHPSVAIYVRSTIRDRSTDELTTFRRLLDEVIADRSMSEVLDVAVRGACDLFDGDGASIARFDPDTNDLDIVAACGSLCRYIGVRVPVPDSRSEVAMRRGGPVRFLSGGLLGRRSPQFETLAFGEMWIAPLKVDGEDLGVLVLASDPGRLLPADVGERLESFIDVLGLGLEIAAANQHRSALALVADHERIARDLHDVVIQRLIAAAMRLEAMSQRVDTDLHGRLSRVIDDLDRVTRDIRSTVFDLQRDDDRGRDLRDRVIDVVNSTADAFGLVALCQIDANGPTTPPEGLWAHLLATTREAVSNVGRHAHASHVRVEVSLDDPLVLVVTDDGRGIDPQTQLGNGLKNLAARAHELGGTLTIEPADGQGTTIRWTAPWPSSTHQDR